MNIVFLSANIEWPVLKFKNIWDYSRRLSEHKAFEAQFYRNQTLVGFEFHITSREDHAGVRFQLSLFNHTIDLHYYDSRHWNHNEDRFYTKEEIREQWEYYAKDIDLRETLAHLEERPVLWTEK